MHDMRPEYTYTACLFAIVCPVIWAGAVDATLYLHQTQTISQWLRQNPGWFVYPMALALMFFGLLNIHLFAR